MLKNIIYNEQEIYYNIIGTGNTVFLIHGFGEDASIWSSTTTYLQKDFQCITIDLPGTGNTPFQEAITNIDAAVLLVKAILDAEKIVKCTLLGHSMGGYIALAFAQKYEHYLTGLGLIHSTATVDTKEKIAARLKSIMFIEDNSAALFLEQSKPNLFAEHFVDNNYEFVKAYCKKIGYIKEETLVCYLRAMMERKEHLNYLEQTTLPILFVIGKEDKAIPFAISTKQCYLPKISYIHILENVGHMGMIEDELKFNKIVKNFLIGD